MLKTLTLFACLTFHPVHVTLTSIDHVQGTDSLKVFFRMYYDDFLQDYKLSEGNEVLKNLSDNQLLPADLMNNYFKNKVNIYINNKLLIGKLLEMTLKDNEISLDLLYRTDRKPKKITVRNMIMTGLYSDQANMTIIRINDFEEGIRLTPEITERTFRIR